MDIAALSIIKNQAQLKQSVSIAMMKKAMGTAEQKGNFITEMLGKVAEGNVAKQATPPHLGTKLDTYV